MFPFLKFWISFLCFVCLSPLSQVPEGAGLAAQAGHDDDYAAADHRDGVHPV